MRYKKKQRPIPKKIQYKGQTMASESEVRFAMECDDHGIPWIYEPESFDWYIMQKYTPDFKITRPDGTHFYVEFKGFLWEEDKIKMRAVKSLHPTLDVRFVFADAKKPVHGAKTRKNGTKMSHAEWAERYGFMWAQGFIPPEWLAKSVRRLKK